MAGPIDDARRALNDARDTPPPTVTDASVDRLAQMMESALARVASTTAAHQQAGPASVQKSDPWGGAPLTSPMSTFATLAAVKGQQDPLINAWMDKIIKKQPEQEQKQEYEEEDPESWRSGGPWRSGKPRSLSDNLLNLASRRVHQWGRRTVGHDWWPGAGSVWDFGRRPKVKSQEEKEAEAEQGEEQKQEWLEREQQTSELEQASTIPPHTPTEPRGEHWPAPTVHQGDEKTPQQVDAELQQPRPHDPEDESDEANEEGLGQKLDEIKDILKEIKDALDQSNNKVDQSRLVKSEVSTKNSKNTTAVNQGSPTGQKEPSVMDTLKEVGPILEAAAATL